MSTTTLTKCVCVWLDSVSDGYEPKWIVSRDQLDDRSRAEESHTLSVHDTEAEAMAEGRAQAKRLGLPLYRNPDTGVAELVEPAAV